MKLWKEFLETNSIKEENTASGGHIAGLGDDHPDRPGSGEPGFEPTGDGRKTWWRKNAERLRKNKEKREERKAAKEQKFAEDIKNKTENVTFRTDAITPVPDASSLMPAMQNSNLPKKNRFVKKRTT